MSDFKRKRADSSYGHNRHGSTQQSFDRRAHSKKPRLKFHPGELSDLKPPWIQPKHPIKPVSDPHTSHASEDPSERAREIVAIQAQINWDLKNNESLRNEYKKLAGEDVNTAALNLGQVLNSKQPLLLACADTTSTEDANHVPIPPMPSLNTLLDRSAQFPPDLPPCLDKKLEDVAFTYRTYLSDAIFHKDHEAYYDRLEFVGDAYIEVIATRLLYNRFPNIPVGKLAHLRENLVKNETLAEFSMLYHFDERAKLPDIFRGEMARGANLSKNFVKVLGDMFEAYVAAVIMGDPAHGFGAVETWLAALWRRQLPGKTEIREADPMAKADLARKVLGRGIKLEYQDLYGAVDKGVPGRHSFTVAIKLWGWGWEGAELGRGEEEGVQTAGMRAAMAAIVNPLTAQVAQVKYKYDELVKKEREREGGPDQAVIDELDKIYKHSPPGKILEECLPEGKEKQEPKKKDEAKKHSKKHSKHDGKHDGKTEAKDKNYGHRNDKQKMERGRP